MAITLQETFRVPAPKAQAWQYISDPMQVAPCLPGAELTEVVDDRTYNGKVEVKVGPIVARYNGTATIQELDPDAGLITLFAKGDQVGAVGRAESTVTCRVTAVDENETEVVVEAELQIGGRLAQFGSGMIERVGKMLFGKFAECAQKKIVNGGNGA